VQGTASGAPVYPNVPQFSGSANLVAPSITAFDHNFRNAYQEQANLQVERQLGDKFQLTVGYQFAALRHGLYYADVNLTPSGNTLADGRPIYLGRRVVPIPASVPSTRSTQAPPQTSTARSLPSRRRSRRGLSSPPAMSTRMRWTITSVKAAPSATPPTFTVTTATPTAMSVITSPCRVSIPRSSSPTRSVC
jgi:hypothetical protein